MSDVDMRTFAFCHAREIEGPRASIVTIIATAELIYRFLAESRGTKPTKH